MKWKFFKKLQMTIIMKLVLFIGISLSVNDHSFAAKGRFKRAVNKVAKIFKKKRPAEAIDNPMIMEIGYVGPEDIATEGDDDPMIIEVGEVGPEDIATEGDDDPMIIEVGYVGPEDIATEGDDDPMIIEVGEVGPGFIIGEDNYGERYIQPYSVRPNTVAYMPGPIFTDKNPYDIEPYGIPTLTYGQRYIQPYSDRSNTETYVPAPIFVNNNPYDIDPSGSPALNHLDNCEQQRQFLYDLQLEVQRLGQRLNTLLN